MKKYPNFGRIAMQTALTVALLLHHSSIEVFGQNPVCKVCGFDLSVMDNPTAGIDLSEFGVPLTFTCQQIYDNGLKGKLSPSICSDLISSPTALAVCGCREITAAPTVTAAPTGPTEAPTTSPSIGPDPIANCARRCFFWRSPEQCCSRRRRADKKCRCRG